MRRISTGRSMKHVKVWGGRGTMFMSDIDYRIHRHMTYSCLLSRTPLLLMMVGVLVEFQPKLNICSQNVGAGVISRDACSTLCR